MEVSFVDVVVIWCSKRVSTDEEKREIITYVSNTPLIFLCSADTWLSKMEKTLQNYMVQ